MPAGDALLPGELGQALLYLLPYFPQEPSCHPLIPRPETFAAVQVTFTFGI